MMLCLSDLCGVGGDEVSDDGLELLFEGFGEDTTFGDAVEEVGLGRSEVVDELGFEVGDLLGLDDIEVTSDTGVDDADLGGDIHWLVLVLLEELSESSTSGKLLLGGGVHVGTELGEGGDLSELGEIELHGTRNLLHGLHLGGGTDSGDGKTDVDGGSDTLEEKFVLQEDLSISNGDDVGWDVSGDITSLGLDDGESGEGTGTSGVGHLGCSLEESRVEVEDITGVGFSSWRSSEKEGHLSVGNSLLGQIVEEDDGVSAVVSEPFTHGATRVGSKVLKGSGVGSGGNDDDGVLEGTSSLKSSNELGNGGLFLADGDVDAVKLLGLVVTLVESGLVQHGVKSDGGLSGLSITDDQLSLTSTDGDKGVDGLKTSLHRLVDGLSGNDTGSLKIDLSSEGGVDWSKTIEGVTETVDGSAKEFGSDWDIDDGTGSLDGVTFLDESIVTEDDNTNVVSLQVQGHTLDTGGELNHLLGLDVSETMDSGNTVTNGQDLTGLLEVRGGRGTSDALFQKSGDFSCSGLLGGDRGGRQVANSSASNLAREFGEHSVRQSKSDSKMG